MADLEKELKLSKQLYEQLVFQRNRVKDLECENQKAEKRAAGFEGGCCKKIILFTASLILAKYKKLSELFEEHKFLFSDGVDFLKLQVKALL